MPAPCGHGNEHVTLDEQVHRKESGIHVVTADANELEPEVSEPQGGAFAPSRSVEALPSIRAVTGYPNVAVPVTPAHPRSGWAGIEEPEIGCLYSQDAGP